MKITNTQRYHRKFTYNGSFGPTIPIIEPEIIHSIKIDKTKTPIALHVITNIRGFYNSNELIYEVEEYCEINFEDNLVTANAILPEVIDAAYRCFDDSHKECIAHQFVFPFSNTPPKLDTKKILSDIEIQLSN